MAQAAVPGRKSVDVRARKGYYAPSDDGDAGHRRPGVDSALQEALDSPYEIGTIPLRMTHFVGDETTLGKAHVEVVTEVDLRGLDLEPREGRYLGGFEFLLVTAHRETGESFRYDQKVEMKLLPATRDRLRKTWFPVRREFDLQPGGYQAKIVVRDVRSGRVATVVHRFEVPEIAAFRVSTPSSPTAAGRGTRVTIGEVYDARGNVLIELAREYRRMVSYNQMPQICATPSSRRRTRTSSPTRASTTARCRGSCRKRRRARWAVAEGWLRIPAAASPRWLDPHPAARARLLPPGPDAQSRTATSLVRDSLALRLCPRPGRLRHQQAARKLEEVRLTLWLENEMRRRYGSHEQAKREIFARYASFIYLGNGRYGFAAASEYYFGKTLSSYTMADAGEAALLAGISKSPGTTRRDPATRDRCTGATRSWP